MNKSLPLWQPEMARLSESSLHAFAVACGQDAGNYQSLHQWSIQEKETFWSHVWEHCGVIGDKGSLTVLENPVLPGARWFPDAKLNFTENLLGCGKTKDEELALISVQENGERNTLNWGALRRAVDSLAWQLQSMGIVAGDRIAAFMPNQAETIVCMLATARLGAIWSSCSPDFGLQGVLDRFGQITPRILVASTAYHYNGKRLDCVERIEGIVNAVSSVEQLVLIDMSGAGDRQVHTRVPVHRYKELIDSPPGVMGYERFPFNHPLYLMYSSGTTGEPKCILHGAGGTLLQHLKEHRLHVDLKPGDRLFYYTTCGWMMWNWLVSGLATGACLILYDGSPFFPDSSALLRLIDEEAINVFGVSARYLSSLEKTGMRPKEQFSLTSLKTILSTGSPLGGDSFRFVYRDFKEDVCLSSITGGTDIISCFALGNSSLPVYEGEIQCKGLGMDVQIFNDQGVSVEGEKGELVCCSPFPSMPLGFWNDEGNKKYLAAYFSQFEGVWAHGDYGEVTDHQGLIIHGRSDAVLNPGGVRIGTAEIYRLVESIPEVADVVCIGQEWNNDVRVILFLVLAEGLTLTEKLEADVRQIIRSGASPRHVPARIIQVQDIPRTISGKIVELAVRNVVHDLPVKNTDALANPEALELFRDLPELRVD